MSKNKKITAIFFAILAAVLYAINMPFSKLLLNNIEPTMLASYLYLGAGIGIGILFLFTHKKEHNYEPILKKDLIYVILMIVLDILAPILLMFGLKTSSSSSASLLNNFEIVATSLIALLIFKESISKRMWLAIFLVTCSSFFLSLESFEGFKFSFGSILVLLATCSWGLENNCTRNLANKNTYQIVFLKGIFSGLGSLIVALLLKESFPLFRYFILALLLGFIAYGLSIFFYIKAQKNLGASKTSAYYSIAPFVGTFLSFIFLKEKLDWSYFIGLIIMILGTVIIVIDTLAKEHNHEHSHKIVYFDHGVKKEKIITHSHKHTHILNETQHDHYHSHKVKNNL